jgi:SAM-dependent methyltransferase
MSSFKDITIEKFTDNDWIELAYICLLQRKIDNLGYNFWLEKVQNGTFNYKELIDTLMHSPEYIMHYEVPFSTVLHQTRVHWVTNLPFFSKILDIGGSSPNTPLGALIELGYSHRPRSITILDLPPEEQYWGTPQYEQQEVYRFSWGEIKYIHGSAEKINSYEELSNEKFDCIFMGQTIEHIEREYLENCLRWIFSHLSDEGHLIFDTPNRLVTKLQSPNLLIDSDHKYEYTPAEMKDLLNFCGFEIINRWGFLDMPESIRTKIFNPLEVYTTKRLTNNVEESYCFAYECGKMKKQHNGVIIDSKS